MSKKLQLKGKQFGRWTVLEYAGTWNRNTHWKVRCDCGTERVIKGTYLTSGQSRSCGCLMADKNRERQTHGETGSRLYYIWCAMRYRCENPTDPAYSNYGARGIKVCNRWQSFENFRADMGRRPKGKTLDRIDNDGDYEPSNCCWSTYVEQTHNTRRNRWVTFNGKTLIVSDWARETGISESLIRYRLNHGWTTKQALTTQPGERKQ